MAFQRLMNKVLKDFIGPNLVCYLDDVCLATSTEEEHIVLLDKVLSAFEKANLKLYPTKCVFMAQSVEFLGHKLSARGKQLSDDHVKALKTFPVPNLVKAVRRFVGLATFFCNFIPNRAKLTAPLTALTKKNVQFKLPFSQQNLYWRTLISTNNL